MFRALPRSEGPGSGGIRRRFGLSGECWPKEAVGSGSGTRWEGVASWDQAIGNRSNDRAGDRGGARAGKPRWVRILAITGGFSMAARIVKVPPPCGHCSARARRWPNGGGCSMTRRSTGWWRGPSTPTSIYTLPRPGCASRAPCGASRARRSGPPWMAVLLIVAPARARTGPWGSRAARPRAFGNRSLRSGAGCELGDRHLRRDAARGRVGRGRDRHGRGGASRRPGLAPRRGWIELHRAARAAAGASGHPRPISGPRNRPSPSRAIACRLDSRRSWT